MAGELIYAFRIMRLPLLDAGGAAIGRLDDIGHDGMLLVEQIVQVYRNYSLPTQVLVASVRSPVHVLEGLRLGAHVATIPFDVIGKLLQHPLTDLGLQRFLADAAKIPKD